jgi:hypothetical protein
MGPQNSRNLRRSAESTVEHTLLRKMTRCAKYRGYVLYDDADGVDVLEWVGVGEG